VDEQAWDAVAYESHLAGGVLALHRRSWGDIEIADADYHRWQYQENPAGPALAALACERRTGELVGQFGAVPLRVRVDGETHVAALALNVVTDSAYRRRGAFIRLARAADEQMARAGVEFAFALPNENSFPGFVRRLGYHHVGDVPLLVRLVNMKRLVAQRAPLPGLGTLATVVARPLVPPLPSAVQAIEGVTVTPVERFDNSFDTFWQTICDRQRVMVVRDATYLDWRFRRIPLRSYQCFRATADGEQAGYIVLRAAEIAGMQAGLVVDFVVGPAPAGERAGRALLAQAMAHFAGEDVDLLASLMLAHAPEYRLLRRAGFRPLPRPLLPQRFRLVARDGPVVRDLRHWFLTMGDYDAV
jgi:GNAT superfamily N-acetyltransferase